MKLISIFLLIPFLLKSQINFNYSQRDSLKDIIGFKWKNDIKVELIDSKVRKEDNKRFDYVYINNKDTSIINRFWLKKRDPNWIHKTLAINTNKKQTHFFIFYIEYGILSSVLIDIKDNKIKSYSYMLDEFTEFSNKPRPTAYQLFEIDDKLFTFIRDCSYSENMQLVTDQLYYLDFKANQLYRCVLKASTTVKDTTNYFNDSLDVMAIQNHLINTIAPNLYKQKVEQFNYYVQTNPESRKGYSDIKYSKKIKQLTPISFVVYLTNKQLRYISYNPTEKIWTSKLCIPELPMKSWQKKKQNNK